MHDDGVVVGDRAQQAHQRDVELAILETGHAGIFFGTKVSRHRRFDPFSIKCTPNCRPAVPAPIYPLSCPPLILSKGVVIFIDRPRAVRRKYPQSGMIYSRWSIL